MTLYEINQAILDAIEAGTDPETGEVTNLAELSALQMQRDEKIENTVLYLKGLAAEVKAIGDEVKALTDRKASLSKKAERLKEFVAVALDGQKFESPRCKVSWRKSTTVEVLDPDDFINWAQNSARDFDFLRYKTPEINKTAIKAALAAGEDLGGYAMLAEHQNISIK